MIDTSPSNPDQHGDRKYGNFRDPVGLVLRMLKSGNRAAYSALLRAGLSIGAVPLDWTLQWRERRRLAAVDLDAPTRPLVLIVGPPRSGSTLLYQTLAHYADVSYLTNLTSLFPRSPLCGTHLLQKSAMRQSSRRPGGLRKATESTRDFRSYYGQTAGWRSPNDGFEVWNRWLGGDRYETLESLDPKTIENMRRFFAAWTQNFDRPFLNKNNRNAHCLRLLADALPQATFVIIRRNPLFVAQSLIEARLRVQGAKDRSWGLASTEHHTEANEPFGYVDDVCDQLLAIETRLCDQSALIDPKRLIELTYEEFCNDPAATLRRIANGIEGLQLHEDLMSAELKPFTVSSTVRLTTEEQHRIEQRITNSPLLQSNVIT